MPGDNAATVAVGASVEFPNDGPTSGTIVRSGGVSPSAFVLPAIGTYEITWQVSVTEAGQLILTLDSEGGAIEQVDSVVGRATGTSQIVGNTFITTTAGGTHPVSATLTIKQIG